MAVTYYQSNTASDLSAGGEFNKALATTGITSGSISFTINASETKTGYFFTPVGTPSTAGITGSYTVKLNITTGHVTLSVSVQLRRVNSVGTVQASSVATATQTASGVLTFSIGSTNLGTWAAGDRLRVDIIAQGSSGTRNLTYAVGVDPNQTVAAPWNPTTHYSLPVSTTSYAITPKAVALRASRKIAVASTSFTLTPQQVVVSKSTVATYSLAVDSVPYAITAQSVGVAYGRKIAVQPVSYQLTPSNVALLYGGFVMVQSTSYTLTPHDVDFIYFALWRFFPDGSEAAFSFVKDSPPGSWGFTVDSRL